MNTPLFKILFVCLLFVMFEKSLSCEADSLKYDRIKLIELVDTKFIFDSDFFDIKYKDTNYYLLFVGNVKTKSKIDTSLIIVRNDKFGQSLKINQYYNLKICKFHKCLKLFYDNLNIIDIDLTHVLSEKEKISVGWLSIIKSNSSRFKNYTYYVAEEW